MYFPEFLNHYSELLNLVRRLSGPPNSRQVRSVVNLENPILATGV